MCDIVRCVRLLPQCTVAAPQRTSRCLAAHRSSSKAAGEREGAEQSRSRELRFLLDRAALPTSVFACYLL